MDCKNIVFLSRQPKNHMPELWSVCDVALIHLKNVKLFETVIPSKIFEAMAMGIPMIIAAPKGEATSIIEGTESGIAVEPEDSLALSRAILAIKSNPNLNKFKLNSKSAAEAYDRVSLAKRMLEIIDHVAKRNGS